ncbi:MAG: SUKH-3 domain-containing protein [Alphaproteobacteria bacterium]|nr:SUKH-3 domain-containing protein [Alphaproteobacteria bacterium]
MNIKSSTTPILTTLRQAGWIPGRSAKELVDQWEREFFSAGEFSLHATARAVLLEFGGLSFEQDGPGETVARRSFCFDPTVAAGESDRFAEFERALGTHLCPIGEAEASEAFLLIAEDGRVLSAMDDAFLIGWSIEEAISALVLGRLGEFIRTEQAPA